MTYKTEQKDKLLAFLLAQSHRQLAMSEIISAMKAEGVGESTVYRLMRELVDSGRVRRFVLGCNRRFFYQAVNSPSCEHHMHLKCIVCGRLVHLNGFVSDFIEQQVLAANRFAIDENMTLLYGRCAACRQR